mgnify:FL=1
MRADPENEEVNTELYDALDKVIAAAEANMFGPSPRLSDAENDQYIVLKKKALVERRSENFKWFDRVKLNAEEESLYQKLEAKADGRDLE